MENPRIGAEIDPQKVDYGLLRQWLNFCGEKHKSGCSTSPGSVVPGLRVINCLTQKVVVAPENCEYVALSYLWGKTLRKPSWKAGAGPARRGPSRHYLATRIVQDAMIVVLELGETYLRLISIASTSPTPQRSTL